MSELRRMGVDPGFGGVKVAEVRGRMENGEWRMETRCVSSVVGVGTMEAGALGLAGVVRGRRGEVPKVVEFEGVEYLVGANVARYARPIERMDFARFTEGPELRALLYAALFEVLDGKRHRVALAVGLPVEILQDAGRAREVERGLVSWLVGSHRFTVDGVMARFEVEQVKAKIAQPVGTWFDWGLDLQGQWCKGRAAVKAPCLVVDQGFNTLDLLVVEGARISTRYTSGDTLGMRRAAEMVEERIRRRYGVELSLHEADGLVQRVVAKKRATVYVGGELVNVTPEVRQALNGLGTEVLRFVERSVGSGRKFRILLTGGGALALAERLLRQYGHAEMMQEPVLANARGLAKLAVRTGFFGE